MRPGREPLVAALLALLFHAGVLLFGAPGVLEGRLVDPDCYVRLMRIERLLATGAWWDGLVPLLDAPSGFVMHWTRPFDLVVLAASLPLMPFLELKQALFWGGALTSPLLQAVAAALLAWAAVPYAGRRGALLAVVLFLVQPAVYGVYQVGRADHHSLHLTLAMATFAPLLVWSLRPGSRALPAVAGLAAAAGLWVGAEALMTIAIAGGALAIAWLLRSAGAAAALWRFAAALAAGTVLALLVERPPGDWLSTELDRISAIHVVLALVLAAAAGLVALVDRRRPECPLIARLGVAAVAGLLVLAPMALLFPAFFAGPYGEVDPQVAAVFLANVREAEPLLARGSQTLTNAVFALGGLAVGLPFALGAARFGPPSCRFGWLLLALAMVVYLAATLHQVRVLAYVQAVAALPWAAATLAAAALVLRRLGRPWRAPAAALAALLLLTGPALAAALLRGASGDAAATPVDRCDWQALSAWLEETRPAPGRTIATYVFPGAQIAWRTGYGTVSAPYHRNAAGILDVERLFRAAPDEGLAIARRRDLGLVAICTLSPGRGGHDWYIDLAGEAGLYGQLAANRPPSWLVPVGTDDPRLANFRVFVVVLP